MSSRFEIVNEEYIAELKDKSENENMKNNMDWWKKVLKSGWMKETCKQI